MKSTVGSVYVLGSKSKKTLAPYVGLTGKITEP